MTSRFRRAREAILRRLADEYASRLAIDPGGQLRPGGVLHRGIPDYQRPGWSCDRFLIVNDETWLLLAPDSNEIIASAPADYYGRIHWEDACPNKYGAAGP